MTFPVTGKSSCLSPPAMLDIKPMDNFQASGIYSRQAHVKIPEGHFEEEHGRKGFYGRVAHLYHQTPPVSWIHIEGDLRPHCLPPCLPDNCPTTNFSPC